MTKCAGSTFCSIQRRNTGFTEARQLLPIRHASLVLEALLQHPDKPWSLVLVLGQLQADFHCQPERSDA